MDALDTQTELFDLFGETGTCAVCQDDLKDGERVRTIRACQHLFHAKCLDPWLLQKGDCPMCRTKLTLTPTHASQIQLDGVRSAHTNIQTMLNTLRTSGSADVTEGTFNLIDTLLQQVANSIAEAEAALVEAETATPQDRTVLTYCLVEGLLRQYPTAADYTPQRQAVIGFLTNFQLGGMRPVRIEFETHSALKEAKQTLARSICANLYPGLSAADQNARARNVRFLPTVRTMRDRLQAARQAAGAQSPLQQHLLF